ncbi:hypothetical protein [Effusibacillus pohliae]|uniref:hypothetical protein n=1 Tax=Effusibacillus pohliae TaxID=232270 RepID=UPI00037C65EE|nr:hypothetical protein [Effusibacillus pohliae]
MKNIMSMLTITAVTLTMLAGCGEKKADAPQSSQQQPQQTQQAQQQPQMSDQDKAAEVVRQFLTAIGEFDYRKPESFHSQEKLLAHPETLRTGDGSFFPSRQDKLYQSAVKDREVSSIVEPAKVKFVGQKGDTYEFEGSIHVVGTNEETKQKVEDITLSGTFKVTKQPDGKYLITSYQFN